MLLYDGLKLLYHHQTLHPGGKIQDQLFRQRPYHTQLQYMNAVTKHFLYILIGGAGGDDAKIIAISGLVSVDGSSLRIFGQIFHALLYNGMPPDGIGRRHGIL